MDKRYGKVQWGPNGTRVLTSPENWRKPLKWNREAEKAGTRTRVFCASLCDVFEDWDGPILNHRREQMLWNCAQTEMIGFNEDNQASGPVTMDDIRRNLFALIDATPHLDWQVLTKRPENIRKMWPVMQGMAAPFPGMPGPLGQPMRCVKQNAFRKNVWLGCSIATQADADKNIPELLKCRDLSPVLFVSAEPLVERVDLFSMKSPGVPQWWQGNLNPTSRLDWVIVGGESGHNARPCDVAWIRSLRDQCQAAGVACFVKQLGAGAKGFSIHELPHGMKSFVDSKGGSIEEWPNDLKIRQFPKVEAANA